MAHINILDFDEFGHRLLMEDPVMKVVLLKLRGGESVPENAGTGLMTLYVVSGRVRLEQGSESSELAAADLLRIPPGQAHALHALQDSTLLVTIVSLADAAMWNALAPSGKDLDLRPTPRPRRHSTVFHAFDSLAVGESFFVVNDHDPRPLRMQIEQARPGQMEWKYLVQGPQEFRIQVTRVGAAVAN